MSAPVQVLVVGFDQPSFSGEVLVELARLREAGIVRLVDLLLVNRGEDGTFQTLDPPIGSTAAVALLEHVWAGPLSAAIGRAGGTPLEEAWLAPEDRELLDTLVTRRAAGARPDGG